MPKPKLSSFSALSILAGVGLSAALVLPGCALRGSGTEASEVRELESFDSIALGGLFELSVHVDPNATQKVEVHADDNLLPKVITEVSGGQLELSIDHFNVRPKQPIHLEIWVPALVEIDASGASDLFVEGLHGERFELEVSGASDVTLSGTVNSFVLDSSGASEVEAVSLQAKQVELELSGASDVRVFASEELDLDVSGASKVRYAGDPSEVKEDISGAADVRAL